MSNVIDIGDAKRPSGKIIGLASIKGGVGKSTLASNAVGWLHALGYGVILVDCDEPKNRSATKWISAALPTIPIVHIESANDLWDELPPLREHAQYIVVDSPGSSELMRQLFMRCNVAIVPTRAGELEADPLVETVRILRQAQELRNGQPEAAVVLSQVGKGRGGQARLMTREIQILADRLEMPLARTPIWTSELHNQASYYRTFVWNMGGKARPLASDLDELFYELLPETIPKKKLANG